MFLEFQIGLIGGGHGFSPIGFSGKGGSWKMCGLLEAPEATKKEAAGPTSGASAARAMFEKMNLSNQAPAKEEKKDDSSWKSHQSPIIAMSNVGKPGSATFAAVTTTAMDGRLITWDLRKTPVPADLLGL